MLLDVIHVEVLESYMLLVTFENGEVKKFDMQKYIDLKPYNRIKGYGLFKQAKIEYGTVVWPGEIDIAPEMLYENSELIQTVSLDSLKHA